MLLHSEKPICDDTCLQQNIPFKLSILIADSS